MCGAATASPSPLGVITEYPMPHNGVDPTPTPVGIAAAGGDVWFTDRGTATGLGAAGPAIGSVDPATHAFSEYPVPSPPTFGGSPSLDQLSAGPGGELSFIDDFGIGMINRFTHALSEDQITTDPVHYTGPIPYLMAAGPDGNVWFTAVLATGGASATLGIFHPLLHAFTLVPLPIGGDPHRHAFDIAAGPDGNMWFTENGSSGTDGAIGVSSVSSHAIHAYPLPESPPGHPRVAGMIASGSDDSMWFIAGHDIGTINVSTHVVAIYPIPASVNAHPRPYSIAAGPGGTVWFTDTGSDPSIGIIDPVTHAITEQSIPGSGRYPLSITAGPDGNMWYTDSGRFSGTIGAIGIVTVPRKRPRLSRLRVLSRKSIVAGRRALSLTVGYRLTLDAGVTLTVTRVVSGRIVTGRCVAPTHANRHHQRCSRASAAAESINHVSRAGANSITLASGTGRSLAPGSYALTATPLGGAGSGTTRTVRFRIAS
jgi:streptogramin lyase